MSYSEFDDFEPVKDPLEPCVGKDVMGWKCVIEHGHGETACGLVPRWWNIRKFWKYWRR